MAKPRKKPVKNEKTNTTPAQHASGKKPFHVEFMNAAQNSIGSGNSNFNPSDYFYYKVVLDYDAFTYKVFTLDDTRVGETNPITWYEYVNP